MLKTKTVSIDGQATEVRPDATLADVVPFGVQSIATTGGALIPREQFARVPVPEGFDTNLSVINKGRAGAGGDRSMSANGRLLHGLRQMFASFIGRLAGLAAPPRVDDAEALARAAVEKQAEPAARGPTDV